MRLQAGGGGLQFKLLAATPPKLTSIVVLPLKVTLSTKKKYPSLALTVTEAIGPPPTFKVHGLGFPRLSQLTFGP